MINDLPEKILRERDDKKIEDQLYTENHYKELLQHCFLFALSKTNFFNHTAFHGGTCLRIVDKIDRFSEDLDFVLINTETTSENLANMINEAVEFLNQMGLTFEVTHNNINNNIQKIWLKEGSLAKRYLDKNPKYVFQGAKSKIKVEIDIDPPKGSITKKSTLNFPDKFKVTIQDHSSSFSGKIHAVLCRDFLNDEATYIKGRDYFDLDWYLSHQIQPNYKLLKNALLKAGPYKNQKIDITPQWLNEALNLKLKDLDWKLAINDMTNFLLNTSLDQLDRVLNYELMSQKLNSYLK